MHTVLSMFDGFLADPEKTRALILAEEFSNIVSEVDQVEYPEICITIPQEIKDEVFSGLSRIVGYDIDPKFIFARMMPKGIVSPHGVHSDRSMGDYSAHIYLSKEWPEGAGTGFYSHDTEGHRETVLTKHDNLNYKSFEKWTRNLFCQAYFNRLLIHDSSFYHCAEPTSGFGTTKEDSRLVLTCFFN